MVFVLFFFYGCGESRPSFQWCWKPWCGLVMGCVISRVFDNYYLPLSLGCGAAICRGLFGRWEKLEAVYWYCYFPICSCLREGY